MDVVESMLRTHLKKMEKKRESKFNNIIIDLVKNQLTLCNKKYPFQIIIGKRNKYELLCNTFYIQLTTKDHLEKVLQSIYYDYSIKHILPIFEKIKKNMQLNCNGVEFK
jgi:hypothetical protein